MQKERERESVKVPSHQSRDMRNYAHFLRSSTYNSIHFVIIPGVKLRAVALLMIAHFPPRISAVGSLFHRATPEK